MFILNRCVGLFIVALVLSACANKTSFEAKLQTQSVNHSQSLSKQMLLGSWHLITSKIVNGNSAIAPRIDRYEFKDNGEVILIDTISQYTMVGTYEVTNKHTLVYSFDNPKKQQDRITETFELYISSNAGINKLQLVNDGYIFTYLPSERLKNNDVIGTWQGQFPGKGETLSSYELILGKNGLADGFIDGKRAHFGYFRYWSDPLAGDTLYLSNQIPAYGNYGIRGYLLKRNNGVVRFAPIVADDDTRSFSFDMQKTKQSHISHTPWWDNKD